MERFPETAETQPALLAHHPGCMSYGPAVSLSRLWHQQGKGTAARHMLSAIYDWFTEGFDTADLQEARALLQA